jgi:hypothetical protein
MAYRVFRVVPLGITKDTQADTLDIVNFYRSSNSDLRHGNENKGSSTRIRDLCCSGGKYDNGV